jgi:tripartite-type tricarboxylate transporter receptor subunit TctC
MVKFSRRNFLRGASGVAAVPVLSRAVSAQAYPTRSVLLLVGYAAGGPTDICARLISQWLSQRLGQQLVVENRTGAGSNIATEAAIHADPDGYTLLLVTSSNAINATLYPHLNFNFMEGIVPIAGIMQTPSVLEVNPSVPVKSVAEFVAYAKANPGKINLGTAGNGSPPHMFAELFMYMTGVKLAVVGYRGGGPALVDLIGGQVQVMFEGITSSIGYLRAGSCARLG